MRYRLYIDESGTVGYSSRPKNKQRYQERYLGLTGVIVSADENEKKLHPKIMELRMLFTGDVDNCPILHADEIRKRNGIFSRFRDSNFESEFNKHFEELLDEINFTMITVVIDKASQKEKYGEASMDPYHHSLTLLLERYVSFLQKVHGIGDIMAECRGKREDGLFGQAYERFYNYGAYYLLPDTIQRFITSKSIKMKEKGKGVAGLQLADLISLPSRLDVLNEYGRVDTSLSQNYSLEIIKRIQKKYFRGTSGLVGNGKKLV